MSLLISLSPNTQSDDTAAAAKMLLQPWQWRKQVAADVVESALASYLQQPAALVSSGRAALAAVLRAYGIGQGDEVIVQAFTCVAVPAAVRWAGATPVFADIAPETFNLDPASVLKRVTSRTKAIIVQHTFGLPADWSALQDIAAKRNLKLIEDCAHALGATYEGRPIGTLGDAAILSFGRDKTISCVFGGAVSSENKEVIAAVVKEQESLPYPPTWWVMQQLLHPLLMVGIKKLYFTFSLGKLLLILSQRIGLLSLAVLPQEKQLAAPSHVAWRYSPALALLLLNQLNKLAAFTITRRGHAELYQRAGLRVPLYPKQANPSWLRFPLRVKNPRELIHRAQARRLVLGDWYKQAVFPLATTAPLYPPGSCPVAEEVAASIVNLPTNSTASPEQVEQVIQFLRDEKVL